MPSHDEWAERQTETTVGVDGHDLTVAYYEDGNDAEGPPVVFLHGIPTWSFLWRNVAPALASDRHVIAPDLVGYGNSAMHDGFDRSIRAQEQVLADLVAEYETVSLVAHDIGGGVALRYASHHPDAVDDLVLSNAACYDSWPVEFVNGLGLPEAADRDAEAFEEDFTFLFAEGLYGDADDHGAFVEGMAAPWRSPAGRTSVVRNAVATNTNHTTEIDYGAITARTLLLWGADDVLQSVDYAERLAEDLAGDTSLVTLSDAYHWVVEDRPAAYRDHVRRFLD